MFDCPKEKGIFKRHKWEKTKTGLQLKLHEREIISIRKCKYCSKTQVEEVEQGEEFYTTQGGWLDCSETVYTAIKSLVENRILIENYEKIINKWLDRLKE